MKSPESVQDFRGIVYSLLNIFLNISTNKNVANIPMATFVIKSIPLTTPITTRQHKRIVIELLNLSIHQSFPFPRIAVRTAYNHSLSITSVPHSNNKSIAFPIVRIRLTMCHPLTIPNTKLRDNNQNKISLFLFLIALYYTMC